MTGGDSDKHFPMISLDTELGCREELAAKLLRIDNCIEPRPVVASACSESNGTSQTLHHA